MTQGTAEQTLLRRTSVTMNPRLLKFEFSCCTCLITVHANYLVSDRVMAQLWKILFP